MVIVTRMACYINNTCLQGKSRPNIVYTFSTNFRFPVFLDPVTAQHKSLKLAAVPDLYHTMATDMDSVCWECFNSNTLLHILNEMI